MKYVTAAVAFASLAMPAYGQPVVPAGATAQPVAVVAQPAVAVLEPVVTTNILRSGSEVPLITREDLTTQKKKLRVGQRFQMEVSANVEANGVVVIPVGTPAIGEITEVRNKGMWGKSGYINGRVISLRLGDRQIRLTGTFDDKGTTGTAGVVGAVVFVPIAGFFMTGTSAAIPTGSAVKAFLDEDIAFRAVAAQPKVIDVPVAAPVAVSPAATTVPAQAQAKN